MVLERAQDLAPDVLMLLPVVSNVEVGQVTLRHPALVGHALRHAIEQGLRVSVRADPDRGAQRFRGLRVTVLADERVAQSVPGVAVASFTRDGGSRGRLGARPVAASDRTLMRAPYGPAAPGCSLAGRPSSAPASPWRGARRS